jgi:hypothetical protein
MPLLKILTDPQDFKFYAGGKGYVSTSNNFGQKSILNAFDQKSIPPSPGYPASLKILTDPKNFKFYDGGKGHVSIFNNFGQKSIPYGNDRPGGGNSGQPYIQTPINGESETSTLGNIDFLLRGGIQAPSRAVDDVARLTKYMFSKKSPSGLLFIAKQNLLSRVSPKTEASKGPLNAGVYTPLSTLAQAGVGYLGSHLNKQGLSPFDGSPLSINKYEDIAKKNNEPGVNTIPKEKTTIVLTPNPSGGVKSKLGTTPTFSRTEQTTIEGGFSNRLLNIWYNKQFKFSNSNDVDVYGGGPGSILGIGKTRIRFADQRTGRNNPELEKFYSKGFDVFKDPRGGSRTFNTEILLKGITSNLAYTSSGKLDTGLNIDLDVNDIFNFSTSSTEPGSLYVTSSLNVDSSKFINNRDIFKEETGAPNNQPTYLTSLNDKYPEPGVALNEAFNIETRLALGDPGRVKGTYATGVTNENFRDQVLDKINASPIYSRTSTSRTIGKNSQDYNDLVSFRIGIIDSTSPNTTRYMNFRAYIDSFSDSYSATWKGQRYMGRAEEFYKYDGFGRDISLAFTVVAHSQGEMHGMYQKLNFLASSLAPKYTKAGYMAGNLAKLTLGDYIYEQPGFISSITYDVPQESSWEISLTPEGQISGTQTERNDGNPDELPFMIKVTGFKFTPIHTFRPEIQPNPITGSENRFITNNLDFTRDWHSSLKP